MTTATVLNGIRMTHLYRGSDGRYYTDYGICRRFESGAWSACMWDDEAGWEVVETGDGELLRLDPVDPAELARASEGDHRADRGLESGWR